jgi:dihydroorotate dehydrogenase
MKCPACGREFKNPVAVAGGEAGGKARVAKGFASPRVQALALKTRKRNARAKRSPNKPVRRSETAPKETA